MSKSMSKNSCQNCDYFHSCEEGDDRYGYCATDPDVLGYCDLWEGPRKTDLACNGWAPREILEEQIQ
jgi:rubredoxin